MRLVMTLQLTLPGSPCRLSWPESDNARGLQVHFINHFSGCQLCTQQNKNEDYKACEREFIKSYEYANSVMMKMLARRTPRSLTLHAQIAGLPFCQVRLAISVLYDLSRQKVHASLLLLRQQDVGTLLHQDSEHITMSTAQSCQTCTRIWHLCLQNVPLQ